MCEEIVKDRIRSVFRVLENRNTNILFTLYYFYFILAMGRPDFQIIMIYY